MLSDNNNDKSVPAPYALGNRAAAIKSRFNDSRAGYFFARDSLLALDVEKYGRKITDDVYVRMEGKTMAELLTCKSDCIDALSELCRVKCAMLLGELESALDPRKELRDGMEKGGTVIITTEDCGEGEPCTHNTILVMGKEIILTQIMDAISIAELYKKYNQPVPRHFKYCVGNTKN